MSDALPDARPRSDRGRRDASADPTRVALRTVVPRDIPLITHSWLRSHQRNGFRFCPPPVFYAHHHRILEALIPRSAVVVAHDVDDLDRVSGWGCAEYRAPTLLVHFMWTRETWRGLGIGTSIIRTWMERFSPTELVWTHTSPPWNDFVRRLRRTEEIPAASIYNPYLAFAAAARAEVERELRR